MNAYANCIALYRLDDTDVTVIQQLLAHHPERIQAVTIDDADALNDTDYHLCLVSPSRTELDCPIPCLILPEGRSRIGHLIDRIETALLQNRYGNVGHGPYYLDWGQSTLAYDGRVIPLTERERYLMAEIIAGGDEGRGRDYLLNRIWGYRADLETHTLETHIYRLRQKIEDEPEMPKRLLSIEGGYRLA